MPTVIANARRRTGCASSRNGFGPAHARAARLDPAAKTTWDVTDLLFGRGRLLLLNAKNHTLVDDEW